MLCFLLLFCILSPLSAQQGTRALARLTPSVVPPAGEVELVIEVRWPGFRGPRIDPSFELDNLEILSGPRRSGTTTILSGPGSQGLSLAWRLRPKGMGRARVFNIRVRVDGTPFELPDCRLEVRTDAPPPPPPPPRLGDLGRGLSGRRSENRDRPAAGAPGSRRSRVFLRAEVTPRRPYRGQQTLYTLYIYYQADVRNIRPREMPQFQGFWVRELAADDDAVLTLENDREYFRSVLLRRVLYPLRAGELEITPTVAEMIVDSPPRPGRKTRGELVRRSSNGLRLSVRELPEDIPKAGIERPEPGLWPVGSLTVESVLESPEVGVGEATVWSLTLRGTAHLQPLPDPTPSLPRGLRLLPVQATSGEEIRGTTIHQLRRWRLPVVADTPGAFTLPEVEFPYFDPRLGRLQIARTPAQTLQVQQRSTDGPLEGALPSATDSADSANRGGLPWPVLLLVLAGALGGGIGFVVHRRRHAADTPQRRLEAALRAAAEASDRHPRKMASILEAAWREFLEAGYLPPGLPKTEWPLALARFGVHGSRRRRQERRAAVATLVEELRLLAQAPQLADIRTQVEDIEVQSRRVLQLLPPLRQR